MSGDLSPPIELDSPLQRRNVSQDRPKGRWAGRATLVLVVLVGLTLASRSLMNQAPLPPAPHASAGPRGHRQPAAEAEDRELDGLHRPVLRG